MPLCILGLSLWIMWFFTKTPFGQIQVGVRDNAMRVDYLGFKVPQTKAVVYVVAAAFAGVAGSVFALFQNLISADSALWDYAFLCSDHQHPGRRARQLLRPHLGRGDLADPGGS